MQDETDGLASAAQEEPAAGRGKAVAEFLFIIFVGLVTAAAFLAALTYELVSARTPLTILVPMLILIGVQINRVRKRVTLADVRDEVRRVTGGEHPHLRGALQLTLWMLVLLAMIWLVGHFAGMALFMLIMLRIMAKESWMMSIGVTAGVTVAIYVLFTHVFRLELYRGLLINFIENTMA